MGLPLRGRRRSRPPVVEKGSSNRRLGRRGLISADCLSLLLLDSHKQLAQWQCFGWNTVHELSAIVSSILRLDRRLAVAPEISIQNRSRTLSLVRAN